MRSLKLVSILCVMVLCLTGCKRRESEDIEGFDKDIDTPAPLALPSQSMENSALPSRESQKVTTTNSGDQKVRLPEVTADKTQTAMRLLDACAQCIKTRDFDTLAKLHDAKSESLIRNMESSELSLRASIASLQRTGQSTLGKDLTKKIIEKATESLSNITVPGKEAAGLFATQGSCTVNETDTELTIGGEDGHVFKIDTSTSPWKFITTDAQVDRMKLHGELVAGVLNVMEALQNGLDNADIDQANAETELDALIESHISEPVGKLMEIEDANNE